MSRKIIGVTVGTPLSPSVIKKQINEAGYATEEFVNENYLPKSALTGYATQDWVGQEFQPKGDYLTKDDKAEIIQDVKNEIGDGVNVSGATLGDMIMVSAVDEDGKPTSWTPIDLVSQGSSEVILPATLFEDNGDNGVYYVSLMPYAIYFEPRENIVSGKTYAIVVDGKKYTVTAEYREYDVSAGGDCVALETADFTLLQSDNGLDDTFYSMGYFPKNPELDDEGVWLYEPMTIGILGDTKPEIKAKYIPSGYASEEWAEKTFQPLGDYLIEDDKDEIAQMAAALVDIPEPSGGVDVSGATPGQMIIVKTVDENGKPTEWEAIDIPNGNGETESTETVIVEEQTVEVDPSEYSDTLNSTALLEDGATYKVVYDGSTFNVAARTVLGITFAGNAYVSADSGINWDYGELEESGETLEDTGEPFCLMNVSMGLWLYAKNANNHTISVAKISKKKIPASDLDMDSIKAAFPTVEMVATLEDGTTATFKLYGEKVTV